MHEGLCGLKPKGSYHAKTHEQDPKKGLLMRVTATLGCASCGKCSATVQECRKCKAINLNRGLGWVGEICTADAEGVKPAKTGI